MKKLLLVMVLFLCSCTTLDWFAGVDNKGNDKPGPAPVEALAKILNTIGGAAGIGTGLGLTTLAAAYVARKKHGLLKSVIEGVQKGKQSLTKEQIKTLHQGLNDHIPEKYWAQINKIKEKMK